MRHSADAHASLTTLHQGDAYVRIAERAWRLLLDVLNSDAALSKVEGSTRQHANHPFVGQPRLAASLDQSRCGALQLIAALLWACDVSEFRLRRVSPEVWQRWDESADLILVLYEASGIELLEAQPRERTVSVQPPFTVCSSRSSMPSRLA